MPICSNGAGRSASLAQIVGNYVAGALIIFLCIAMAVLCLPLLVMLVLYEFSVEVLGIGRKCRTCGKHSCIIHYDPDE